MLIKFFRNGKGAGAGPVGYLVADKVLAYDENRDLIRDADGQPVTVTREPLPEVLPGAWSNREVNEFFGGLDGGCKITSKLSRLNLLYVPGSEILSPDRAAFSSEVQFDEITEWCDDGKEWRWTKY